VRNKVVLLPLLSHARKGLQKSLSILIKTNITYFIAKKMKKIITLKIILLIYLCTCKMKEE